MTDYTPINPKHYRKMPPGINLECIDYIRHLPYSQASAGKYLYRAGNKDPLKQDLEKTLWYVNDAISTSMYLCLADFRQDLVESIDEEKTHRSFLFYSLVTGRLLTVKYAITASLRSDLEDLDLPL